MRGRERHPTLRRNALGGLLTLILLWLLSGCGIHALHTYDYQGGDLTVDTQAHTVDYQGQTYTYVWSKAGHTLTYPDGSYYREVEQGGGRQVSSSWDYSNTPESRGYLPVAVLEEYILAAQGRSGGQALRWGLRGAAILFLLLGGLNVVWPSWLQIFSPDRPPRWMALRRAGGFVLAVCGLGLLLF